MISAVLAASLFAQPHVLANGQQFPLRTLAHMESRLNPDARGKKGELGLFQISRRTWIEVHELFDRESRERSFLFAFDPFMNRNAAKLYLTKLELRFIRAMHRKPTTSELYCCWNLGPHRFMQHYYGKVSLTPPDVRRRAKIIQRATK